MPAEILYDVRCTFTDEAVADAWIAWLHDPHLADVMAAGASAAEVARVRADGIVVEARYRFPSAEAFAIYERDHAPRLRAEGLARFPLGLGLTYQRRVAEILSP